MKLSEINDEFINQEPTLDHLYRVQKARCFELMNYLNYLNEKCDLELLTFSSIKSLTTATLRLTPSSSSELISLPWWSWLSPFSSKLSQQDIDKFKGKVNRMIVAKVAYEQAGGKFEPKKLSKVVENTNE